MKLSQIELRLLQVLASDPTRVFTKQELYAIVWGMRGTHLSRTLDTAAARLRAKVSPGENRFVINVWGVGYRLIDALPPDVLTEDSYRCPTCGNLLDGEF